MNPKQTPNRFRRMTIEQLVIEAFEAQKLCKIHRVNRCEWYILDKNKVQLKEEYK